MKPILLLLSFLVFGCGSQEKDIFDLVLKHGNIIDLENGKIRKQDIYINQGTIEKLVLHTEQQIFEAKEEIDLSGKYVLPGFWDNHVHFRGGDSLISANKNFLKLFIANGITTVRDAGGDLTPSVMAWSDEIASGALTGPTIFTSGPKLDGQKATWAGSIPVENTAEAQYALDSLQRIGTDYVKLYDSQIRREVYLAIIAEAEKRGLITSGHMPFTVMLKEAVDTGIDGIEHLYYIMKGCSAREQEITDKFQKNEIGFWQAMPLLRQSYTDATARHTFITLKENDVFVIPTLHIGKTLSYLDEVDHSKDPYLKYMSAGIQKTYQGRINRVLNSSAEAIQNRKELDAFFGQLAKALNDAGVDLLAGSDSGAYNSFTYPGISLHKELLVMTENGISPLDALRSSAFKGANFLKKSDQYGSVAVGKISDLVVLDANPLEEITNTQKIHLVLKGNRIYNTDMLTKLRKDAIIN